MHILVADDERDMRDTMKVLLEMQGHRVELAADGKQATELAIKLRPDVVFMDMKMPVMDGITATRVLRANPDMSGLPIVCISAYLGQDEWRERAIEAGCNDCLSKPIDLGRLNLLLGKLTRH